MSIDSPAEINNQFGMALLCARAPTEDGSSISSFLGTHTPMLSALRSSYFAKLTPSAVAPNIRCSIIFPSQKSNAKRPTSPAKRRRSCAAVHSSNGNGSTSSTNAGNAPMERQPRDSVLVDDEDDKSQQSNGFRIRKITSGLDLHLDLHLLQRTFHSQTRATDTLTPADIKRAATKSELERTPTASPKESLGQKWREYQGCADWQGLLDPLDANLRREIVKYGEFAQATYDAFDFDSHSKYCGSCRYNRHKLLDKVDLRNTGYNVTKYLYAMSNVQMPKWFGRSDSMDPWSKDSNWMGYVAVCTDENEVKRLGRRDIVISWRGTVTQLEWMENLKDILHPIGDVDAIRGDGDAVKVERGFLSIYTSKSDRTRYNKLSASEQVIIEVQRLVEMYRERNPAEELSITVTGHSLGGALALLNAYELAAKVTRNTNIPVTVFSFGAPRVGNAAFRDKLNELGVKTLRVVNRGDMVPKMPGMLFNEGMEKYEQLVGPLLEALPWTYTHVGVELQVDHRSSPFLKHNPDPVGCHNLEAYLHLVDGFLTSSVPFWPNAKRDVALVNKASDMVRREMMVPANWYQLHNKGLVRNCYGRWVQPDRDPEDVPSPKHVHISCSSLGFDF